eukprot:m51a1_g8761 putative serine threonine kinase (141) ;mRNA; r:126598-127085
MIEIERQIKEIAILSEIRHPNVLLFMGACIEPHNMFIVTEWMDMGNLRQVIRSSPQMDLRLEVAILSSICSALKYLHISNIVHCDLKSSNILVCSSAHPLPLPMSVVTLSKLTSSAMLSGAQLSKKMDVKEHSALLVKRP